MGCEGGLVVIYDFETRGIIRRLTLSSAKTNAIAWGREGSSLAVALADGLVVLLKVNNGEVEAKATLPVPATRLCLSSQDSRICLASCAAGPPQLLDFSKTSICPLPSSAADADGKGRPTSNNAASEAIFSSNGLLIFSNHLRGAVAVLDAQTLKHVEMIKVPGMTKILGLALDRLGKHLLVNCSDRVVRLYSLPSIPHDATGRDAAQLRREFSNAIERTSWRMANFTGNGEHVSAASSSPSEHAIYIWDREFGRLETVLQGPKESILHMAWHPTRSLLATVSSTGTVYIWARVYRENWAAFAPDFEELHDNYEYIEQEDEFDIQEPVCDVLMNADALEDEDDVDIESAQQANDSDEDQETCLHHLLIHIQPDLLAETEDNNAKAVKAPRTDDEEGSISSSDVDNPQPQTARSGSASRPSSLGPLAEDAAGRRQRASRGRSRPPSEEPDVLDGTPLEAEAKRQKI